MFLSSIVWHLPPCRRSLLSAPASRLFGSAVTQNVTVCRALRHRTPLKPWLPRWHVLTSQLTGITLAPQGQKKKKNMLAYNEAWKNGDVGGGVFCCIKGGEQWRVEGGEPESVHTHIPLLRQWWPTKTLEGLQKIVSVLEKCTLLMSRML